MVIKNKIKFLRGILIMVGIIFFINLFIANTALSHQEVSYKTITVVSGDTLWAIAKNEQQNNSYYKGKDIRDVIEDIKKVNDLSESGLNINQNLQIPVYS